TSAITGIVFCTCYIVAAAVFGIAVALSRRPIAEQLRTISPVTLTPLAVILGLLIAFLAARVWENVGRANDYIGQEAGALSKVMVLANALPPEVRTKVHTAITQHVDFVLAQDWPKMAIGRATQRIEPVGLTNAMTAIVATLFIVSTAVAASLVLLMENDRPFAAGGITLTPTAFREIVLN